MHPAGLTAFRQRSAKGGRRYSFESRPRQFALAYLGRLRSSPRAWRFFQSQPPWYRRTSTFWVMSAKREETRARRLAVLIGCSARGRTIPPLTRKGEPRGG
jgi:hypothetical protein